MSYFRLWNEYAEMTVLGFLITVQLAEGADNARVQERFEFVAYSSRSTFSFPHSKSTAQSLAVPRER